ncbi:MULTISPECIES: TetR family transcriptional regulator [unclassified Streptomyces]|uniref:TetR/AcrR family transcriptional regulator n=1 Tax=unclassified Streptomyces TaxID=2593676 RepID=UPI00336A2D6B
MYDVSNTQARPRRADARRNYARLLAAAEAEVAVHGAEVSLEQVARTAQVGSATLRRHFPNRQALLTAVFRQRIEALRALAADLATRDDPRTALLEWLRAVAHYATSARGMAASLALAESPEDAEHCFTYLATAGDPLVRRAAAAGAVRADATAADLLTVVIGIALATEHHPNGAAEVDKLLTLVTEGLVPRP